MYEPFCVCVFVFLMAFLFYLEPTAYLETKCFQDRHKVHEQLKGVCFCVS